MGGPGCFADRGHLPVDRFLERDPHPYTFTGPDDLSFNSLSWLGHISVYAGREESTPVMGG